MYPEQIVGIQLLKGFLPERAEKTLTGFQDV
jgi:hypothetical protein